MTTGSLSPTLVFLPAPADLSPAMLGLIVQRARAGLAVAVPAHALAICTVALSTGTEAGAGCHATPGGLALVTGSATHGRDVRQGLPITLQRLKHHLEQGSGAGR